MKQFFFEHPEEFEQFFKGRNLQISDAIVEGIKVAVKQKKYYLVMRYMKLPPLLMVSL